MLTKKIYNRFLFPITVILLIILIIIARALYGWLPEGAEIAILNPEPFSDWWDTISGLGNWEQSPIGYLYFQLWGLVFGVFLIHITRYVHDRMMIYRDKPIMFYKVYLTTGRLRLSVYYLFGFIPIYFIHIKSVSFPILPLIIFIEKDGKSALYGKFMEKEQSDVLRKPVTAEDFIKLGTFFMLLGGIGFILMGLVPADVVNIDQFHEISAGVGFGGIFFANFLYANCLDQVAREGKVNKWLHIGLQICWWILIIGVVITYPIAEFYFKEKFDLGWYSAEWGEAGVSPIFSFALWERIGFIVGCIYTGGLGWLLPANIKKSEIRNSQELEDANKIN
ncbi:MAG: hypothetical protein GF364_03535 [Candidatus Lokiarchaeota archaeon]|nr:hypothetical protein [Candidatus Lokiarchaeota archaeon]